MTDIVARLLAKGPHGQTEREARTVLYSLLQEAAKEIEMLRRLLYGASKAIDKAYEHEGDVFGKMHNSVVDLDIAIQRALKKEDK